MFGIDLASVDDPGQPDWSKPQSLGLGFVFLRSNYGIVRDPFYASQGSRLKALKIPYGPYLFLCFPFKGRPAAQPEDQAHAMIQAVGARELGNLDFPPVIDIEFPGDGFADTGMMHAQAMDWIRRAYKVLKDKYGIAPIIYTSARVWQEDLGNPGAPDLIDSPLWLARYINNPRSTYILEPECSAPPIPEPWGDSDNWWFHQYQGDALHVPGMGSAADLSRFNSMKLGAKGKRVKWVQTRVGLTGKDVDGDFGPNTQQALEAFQKTNLLEETGEIDIHTFCALSWVKV